MTKPLTPNKNFRLILTLFLILSPVEGIQWPKRYHQEEGKKGYQSIYFLHVIMVIKAVSGKISFAYVVQLWPQQSFKEKKERGRVSVWPALPILPKCLPDPFHQNLENLTYYCSLRQKVIFDNKLLIAYCRIFRFINYEQVLKLTERGRIIRILEL